MTARAMRETMHEARREAPSTWLLTDGHAGNLRQAAALARALGIAPERDLVLAPNAAARLLAPRSWPGAEAALGTDFARALATPPGLAIGCGRQAALATRLLRKRGTRTVQILDPRIASRHWELVVVPEHDRLRGDNVIAMQGSLHPVDDAWLAQAREAHAGLAALPAPRTTLLIGGASRHARLDSAWLEALFTQLETVLGREGGSLLLSASRRTGPALRPALRAFAARWPGHCWLGPEDGANPYPGLLAFADRIVCSPDSVNMLSEACATRVPVFVAAPHAVQGRPRRFVDSLLACGRARPADAVLAPFDAPPLRETARVAALVRERLGLSVQPSSL